MTDVYSLMDLARSQTDSNSIDYDGLREVPPVGGTYSKNPEYSGRSGIFYGIPVFVFLEGHVYGHGTPRG